MKIAICASEVVPFAKTGGLADVAGALPVALEKAGQEVIIIMPGYKEVKQKGIKIKRLSDGVSYSLTGEAVKVYFIEREGYFGRDFLYGDKTGDYKDNLDRFSYYSRKALELLKQIDFKPDVIHLHDWQASLIPVYLKTVFSKEKFFKDTKTLLTIHNIGYQGIFPGDEFGKLGLDSGLFNMEGLEFFGKVNLLKGGIIFSDLINTVSKAYSREIRTEEFGFGLEGVLNERGSSLSGILNGLDYNIWNPQTDKFIAKNFSKDSFGGKAKNKEALQALCKLPLKKDVALFGIVSRLAQQKGFDILAEGIDKICRSGLQLVILGTGDQLYHDCLQAAAKKYPDVISLNLRFDDPLAHKIYAGSDIFLMPSRYEPCGLGQLIGFRYGSVPLVFKTGGLADTVNKDNGFVFDEYSAAALIRCVRHAVSAYKNKNEWQALVAGAMKLDFSWEESAGEYIKLYAKAKQN